MKFSNIFWGVILIFAGVLFILQNLGVINFEWTYLWRLWPVILILWGVSVLPAHSLIKLGLVLLVLGVLGVALIQAVLSALGMMVMDVPAWGLWTLMILVLAIAQLPPILVLGFVSAYVFSVAETTPAVIFLIYCISSIYRGGVGLVFSDMDLH